MGGVLTDNQAGEQRKRKKIVHKVMSKKFFTDNFSAESRTNTPLSN